MCVCMSLYVHATGGGACMCADLFDKKGRLRLHCLGLETCMCVDLLQQLHFSQDVCRVKVHTGVWIPWRHLSLMHL